MHKTGSKHALINGSHLRREGPQEPGHVRLECWALHHHFLVGTRQRDRHVGDRLPLGSDGEGAQRKLRVLQSTTNILLCSHYINISSNYK